MVTQGIVTRHDGPRFWVEAGEDEIQCVLRGRLRKRQIRETSPVVIGDHVDVERQPDGTGTIESVHPRRSELVRPGFAGLAHVMAANVDQLVIVQAARQPNFKRALVERFMAMARRGRMGALLVVNKCDLEQEALIQAWVAPLAASGVPVLLTSTADGRGIDGLRQALLGRISVLAGQSGVGKSSLVNALYPETQARITAISEWNEKGRHTTTSSRLYPLPEGGYLADTPGIRELALFEDDAEATESPFPEIVDLAGGCKFRDCSHSHEPECAVKEAVTRGEIDQGRYRNYLRLNRRR